MEQTFCQSCGMPMTAPEHFGTNKNESPSEEYCVYCYQKGEFTGDVTMDQMIESCLEHLDEFNKDSEHKFTLDEARATMKEYFPSLKRWKQQ